ncbi:MAG: isochorismatase family protein [Micrococcaceae bacterium]
MINANQLDLSKTTLVTIDLQEGFRNFKLAPHSLTEMVTRANKINTALEGSSALITLISVWPKTVAQMLTNDAATAKLLNENPPENFTDLLMDVATKPTSNPVIKITKDAPSAFFDTNLESQLRANNIETIILLGVATSVGVFTTAIDAYQNGYNVIVVEDASTDTDEELHQVFFNKMFEKCTQVVSTDEIIQAIKTAKSR